jgi:hypothetical protein
VAARTHNPVPSVTANWFRPYYVLAAQQCSILTPETQMADKKKKEAKTASAKDPKKSTAHSELRDLDMLDSTALNSVKGGRGIVGKKRPRG